MKKGPGLIAGQIVFPLSRHKTLVGRTDTAVEAYPDIDLAPLAGGLIVSRRHAELERRDGEFFLRDLGSRSGTMVNGDVLGETERQLLEGDAVTIGTSTLRFSAACEWPEGLEAEWEKGYKELSSSTQLPTGVPLIAQLPTALKADQVALHYQPQVVLATGEVSSVEALIRWDHPEMGPIAPDRYLTLAEDSGFIRVLTSFALKGATEAASRWKRDGLRLKVSVNLSVLDLEDAAFSHKAIDAVKEGGCEPSDFTLEITETGIMFNPGIAIAALEHLRSQGFSISIDDFGTGQSSLAYLKDLPADEVKLDSKFASGLERDRTIVGSMIEMAHALGMTVVAEGVEGEDTARFLKEMGCDRAQGFLFGEAVPSADLNVEPRAIPG